MQRYSITGSQYHSADSPNRVVLYCASECVGCFDRSRMSAEVAALEIGESVEYAALRFVDGPDDPLPVIITRTA